MSVFFHLNSHCANATAKGALVVFCMLLLIFSGCSELELDGGHDITEDLHHRLIAGIFEPGKDPFIIHVRSGQHKTNYSVPGSFVHFSSENGNFWVKSDEKASVILYMDTEATFSHIHFSVDRRYQVYTIYLEHPTRPVSNVFTFD